jgi:hypothetical protein
MLIGALSKKWSGMKVIPCEAVQSIISVNMAMVWASVCIYYIVFMPGIEPGELLSTLRVEDIRGYHSRHFDVHFGKCFEICFGRMFQNASRGILESYFTSP